MGPYGPYGWPEVKKATWQGYVRGILSVFSVFRVFLMMIPKQTVMIPSQQVMILCDCMMISLWFKMILGWC